MTLALDKNKSDNAIVAFGYEEGNSSNTIEVVRNCCSSKEIVTNSSWEQSRYVTVHDWSRDADKPPSLVSIMVTESPRRDVEKVTISTQTDVSVELPNVSISFSKEFIQESSSNVTLEHSLRSKRLRKDSTDTDIRPNKKTKCTDSCSSSTSDVCNDEKLPSELVTSSNHLSSASEVSFKSTISNNSYKVRKRRKPVTSLFTDALQRSRRNTKLSKLFSKTENISSCGSPRNEKEKEKDQQRRDAKAKAWKLLELCTWIGLKGYHSITNLFDEEKQNNAKEDTNALLLEMKRMNQQLDDVVQKQSRLTEENDFLREEMKTMKDKVQYLEDKVRTTPCERSLLQRSRW